MAPPSGNRASVSSLSTATAKETGEETLPSISSEPGGASPLAITRTLTRRFQVRSVKAGGPGSGVYFNPTKIRMGVRWRGGAGSQGPDGGGGGSDVALLWSSRDNRKGRNSIAVPRILSEQTAAQFPDGAPELSGSIGQVGRGVWHMFTTFPYWDLPFWTAFWFNLGSLIWLANAFFDWLPVAYPETKFDGETTYAYGMTELVGVIAYALGAFMAYLEAVNYGSLYGSALRRLLDDSPDYQKQVVDEKLRTFVNHVIPIRTMSREAQRDGSRTRRLSVKVPIERRGAMDVGQCNDQKRGYDHFRVLPSWQNLKRYHVREIGFLACTIQFAGAFLFIIPGIVSLPPIPAHLNTWQKNLAYWIPGMIASALFVPSSLLFMLENQDRYWKPKVDVIGWWIGLFALVGSIGFVISNSLGPATDSHPGANYQSTLCCLWASAFFWFSSLLQQYECCNKNVVERLAPAHGSPV